MDDFGKYFRLFFNSQSIHLLPMKTFAKDSKKMSCLPTPLNGIGIEYESQYSPNIGYHVRSNTSCKLSFDMDTDHPEQLLVHEQCGGGIGFYSLYYFRLANQLATEIKNRIRDLPSKYVGIHVRNTDVKTNYREFFSSIKSIVDGEYLLLVTDSHEVIEYANSFFNSKILTVSKIPDLQGLSLHHNPMYTSWQSNIDCFADLIALSGSRSIILPSPTIGYPSGFAKLAIDLMMRPCLVNDLLCSSQI
jgi:hypothetical protein